MREQDNFQLTPLDVLALQVMAWVLFSDERGTPEGIEKAYSIANEMLRVRQSYEATVRAETKPID